MKLSKRAMMDDMFDFMFTLVAAIIILLFISVGLSGGQSERDKKVTMALEDLKFDEDALVFLRTPVSEVWSSYEEDFRITKDTTFADLFVLMKDDLEGPYIGTSGKEFYKTSKGKDWKFKQAWNKLTDGKTARVEVYDGKTEILRHFWGKGYRHTFEINLMEDKRVIISLSEDE